ncbi:GRP family sugar transporter [Sphingobacterium sp. LRF_L2]|uniref:GRP family sugar transporter n=1 Tax=Sphingobacterium sp. LRF_L2 TaxID=3369421 RepID=UPI003F5E579B
MFIVESYFLAIVFCFITMVCWGSWANTQKVVQDKWRFELFYWDYVIGIFLLSLLGAFTMGSMGEGGRSFLVDIQQAKATAVGNAFFGGILFNLANILLTAAIAAAGMAVAFPIGIGLALVIGVVINYVLISKGDPFYLFLGVLFVTIAIVLNALAYSQKAKSAKTSSKKWILVSILAGVLMSLFYPFVAAGVDLTNFHEPAVGKMTPYTAFVVFSVGILASNFAFNSYLMSRPLEGAPIRYSTYFKGRGSYHLVGILGGCIWGLGNLLNFIAAGKAGPAISYGLGQGATLVAALWGVFIWREFKGSTASTYRILTVMFLFFIAGLALIIYAGV